MSNDINLHQNIALMVFSYANHENNNALVRNDGFIGCLDTMIQLAKQVQMYEECNVNCYASIDWYNAIDYIVDIFITANTGDYEYAVIEGMNKATEK